MFDLIPEIVIAVFTETIVNWIKLGVKGIQVFWKSIQALKLITKVGEAANGVVRAFTKIGKVFKTMSGKIGGKLGQMFDKIMDFFKGLTKWGDEAADVNKTTVPGEKNLPETGNVTKTDNAKVPKEEPIKTPKEEPKKTSNKTKEELKLEKQIDAAKLLDGKTGREAFGELRFKGLNQNRKLRDLTHNEIYNSFKNTPYKPSNHAIMRLKDIRTYNLGCETMNDFARIVNNGIVAYEKGTVVMIQSGKFEVVINSVTKTIITFKPL